MRIGFFLPAGSLFEEQYNDSSLLLHQVKEMYDPLKGAIETAKMVCQGDQRGYSRFRPTRFYGGIATADCFGCCLKCIFCWSCDTVSRPYTAGQLYSPEEVARKLISIA